MRVKTMKMNEKTTSIQQLLSQARSGSRTGMGRLAVITWERLYPFVFRLTWNHDMTEDILQETLLAVMQEVNSLRDVRRFWPWVHRIARNKIQDNLRRSRLAACGNALLRSQSSDAQVSGNILDAKIREEKLQRLLDLIEQLSRQHRDVLRLRYYEQMPYTEIASMTHTTPEKARARFHRARKRLKAQLQDDTQQGVSVVV
jgi:RNA polymerase sigma-70 factor (ECF subfamily)